MGAQSWAIQTASKCSGPALNGTLLGHCKKDCEEPHHGINALLPAEAQSNVSSLIPRLHLHVLSVVSLVFSYGVRKQLGHICRAYTVK